LAIEPSYASSYNRIASLTLLTDEVLWELTNKKSSQKILSLSSLVRNRSYSCIADKVANVKSPPSYSVEQIVSMKPDLVLAANFNRPSLLKFLKQSSIPFELFKSSGSFSDLWRNISRLGEIIDEKKQAIKMIAGLKRRISVIKNPKQPQKLVSYSSELFFPGKNSSFSQIAKAAKHRNVIDEYSKDGSWVRLSSESLLTIPIDFIVVGIRPNATKKQMIAEISGHESWKNLPAVRDKKFLFISNAYLLSLSHCMVDAVELLSREVYEQLPR